MSGVRVLSANTYLSVASTNSCAFVTHQPFSSPCLSLLVLNHGTNTASSDDFSFPLFHLYQPAFLLPTYPCSAWCHSRFSCLGWQHSLKPQQTKLVNLELENWAFCETCVLFSVSIHLLIARLAHWLVFLSIEEEIQWHCN